MKFKTVGTTRQACTLDKESKLFLRSERALQKKTRLQCDDVCLPKVESLNMTCKRFKEYSSVISIDPDLEEQVAKVSDFPLPILQVIPSIFYD
ncbi:hypothetical protein ACTXT7_005644 [Hymenolepis weldensis]